MSGTPKKPQSDRRLIAEKKVGFLAVLSECCNVGRACASVGIGRTTAYRWREEDSAFESDWEKALAIGVSALEDEAHRRAFDGIEDPLTYQGQFTPLFRDEEDEDGNVKSVPVLDDSGKQRVATVRKYSDTLAIFLLKAHNPEKYRDNAKITLDGEIDINKMSPEEIINELAGITASGILSGNDAQ